VVVTQFDPQLVNLGLELRRSAPLYLDYQGRIGEKLIEGFGTFNIDLNPVRFAEALSVSDGDENYRAAVSGERAVFDQDNPTDLDASERHAHVFFKMVEKQLNVQIYERVGVLFIHRVELGQSFTPWLHQKMGVTPMADWTVEDALLRLVREVDPWNQICTVQRWIGKDGRRDPTAARVDVDHYMLKAKSIDALNTPVHHLYRESQGIMSSLLEGGS